MANPLKNVGAFGGKNISSDLNPVGHNQMKKIADPDMDGDKPGSVQEELSDNFNQVPDGTRKGGAKKILSTR